VLNQNLPAGMGMRIDKFHSRKGVVFSAPDFRRVGFNHQVKTAINITPRRNSADEGLMIDRAATDFVKGMSHELHTPLHVIIGLCQLLERDRNASLSPGQLDAVERMERNARSLLQTVNHLLACLRSGHFE